MNALELAVAMVAGLVVVALFAARIVGLVACVVGGFSLLGTVVSYSAWSSTHKAAQWLALVHSAQMAALCVGIVVACWFGPTLLMQAGGANPYPPRRAPAPPSRSGPPRAGRAP